MGKYYMRNELTHHGILGMRWGIRRYQNYDGTLTPAGRERYGVEARSIIQTTAYNSSHRERTRKIAEEIFETVGADRKSIDEAYNKAKNAFREVLETKDQLSKEEADLFDEFNTNKDVRTKYEATSEIASVIRYDGEDTSMGDFANSGFSGTWDDGGQTDINSYSLYVYENGLEGTVSSLHDRVAEAEEKATNEAYNSLRAAFDKVNFADVSINSPGSSHSPEDSVERFLSDEIGYDTSFSELTSSGMLSQGYGYEAKYFDSRDKEAIKLANKYVSKINNNDKDGTWYFLHQAVENLGLYNKSLKDMSQSDWDNLNDEIESIKKLRKEA